MDKKITEKIQMIQLSMLLEFRTICDRHNIPYFLCCGTLLGAIRHKGPIPWDDDLDVGLLRKDYEKFLSFASSELREPLFLQTWHTDANYALPHCKIRDTRTHYIEKVNGKSGCVDGISIDVLPFDAVPNNSIIRSLHGYFLFDIMNVLKIKRQWVFIKENDVNAIRELLYRIIAVFTSEKHLIALYEKTCTYYNNLDNHSIVSEAAGLDFFRFITSRNHYAETIDVEYSGNVFKAPKGYDSILRDSYGDYHILPSEDKRKGQPMVLDVIWGDDIS